MSDYGEDDAPTSSRTKLLPPHELAREIAAGEGDVITFGRPTHAHTHARVCRIPIVAIALAFSLAYVIWYGFWYHPSFSYLNPPKHGPGVQDVDTKFRYGSTELGSVCRLRYWRRLTGKYCENLVVMLEPESEEEKPAPLEVFQVHTPPVLHASALADNCTIMIMHHTFAFSYGRPYVGVYTPPPSTCSWTHAVFNLTMYSSGRQFDRLGHLFLGDVEVWRTSTAEPTWYGIRSEHSKDMTHLRALLKEEQTVVFDMGNLVNEIYTGSFKVTLTGIFFTPDDNSAAVKPADMVLPLSARCSAQGRPSHFSLPNERAETVLALPDNTIRTVVSISASGNGDEEFWYTNVPSSLTATFASTTLPGFSPFRELQLLIDDYLVGVVWPEVTVFTGGIVPSLWRPLVAPDAFDLPEYGIDITPHLPILLDGRPHTFALRVASYDDKTNEISTALGSDWLVSARVFVWRDTNPLWKTTGKVIQATRSEVQFGMSSILGEDASTGFNSSLSVSLTASRSLVFISTINTSEGPRGVSWLQGLHYDSSTHLTDEGLTQQLSTTTAGTQNTIHAGTKHYSHPLLLRSVFKPTDGDDQFELAADINLAYHSKGSGRWEDGIDLLAGGKIGSELGGSATWKSGKGGDGRTSEVWAEVGRAGSYGRLVVAARDSVQEDWESVDGKVTGRFGKEGFEESTIGMMTVEEVDHRELEVKGMWEEVLRGRFKNEL